VKKRKHQRQSRGKGDLSAVNSKPSGGAGRGARWKSSWDPMRKDLKGACKEGKEGPGGRGHACDGRSRRRGKRRS